jgi:hypothetical protein
MLDERRRRVVRALCLPLRDPATRALHIERTEMRGDLA